MHVHSSEPRVMPTINTFGNSQSATHLNATSKLMVLWIHSNMLSSLTRLSQILY